MPPLSVVAWLNCGPDSFAQLQRLSQHILSGSSLSASQKDVAFDAALDRLIDKSLFHSVEHLKSYFAKAVWWNMLNQLRPRKRGIQIEYREEPELPPAAGGHVLSYHVLESWLAKVEGSGKVEQAKLALIWEFLETPHQDTLARKHGVYQSTISRRIARACDGIESALPEIDLI